MVQPGQQPYTYQPGQHNGYAPSQYPKYAQAPVQQPRLAYEHQQVPQLKQLAQLMQHFAQPQQQNWGMGSMNGMGMRRMVSRDGVACKDMKRALQALEGAHSRIQCTTCQHHVRHGQGTRNSHETISS